MADINKDVKRGDVSPEEYAKWEAAQMQRANRYMQEEALMTWEDDSEDAGFFSKLVTWHLKTSI